MNRIERGATAAMVALALLVVVPLGAAADSPPTGPVSARLPEPAPDPLFGEGFDFEPREPVSDPLEPANRVALRFNQGLDMILLGPITDMYRFVVPEPARRSVRRMFVNLESPAIFVNDLLQLRFLNAAETFGRFALNSTAGWLGLFDAGKEMGWEHHRSDFGQTLAVWGVPSGPYLVLPLFGPMTVRDGTGDVVDHLLSPVVYLIGPGTQFVLGSGNGLVEFEANMDRLEALEGSSIDFYAALRSAYLQNRQAHIWGAPGAVRQAD